MAPRLTINCPPECQLNPDKIGEATAELLKGLRESGKGINLFKRDADIILGRDVPRASYARHLHHYRVLEDGVIPGDPEKKVGDLEILDGIIAAGARNAKNWKPTIKDTLEAMKLKMQLTGNSAFEDMLAAMEEGIQLSEMPEEAPEALFEEGERTDDGE